MAHAEIKKLCQLQIELAAKAGQPKWVDGAVDRVAARQHAAALRRRHRRAAASAALPATAEAVLAAETPAVTRRIDASPTCCSASGCSSQSHSCSARRATRRVYPVVKDQFGDAVRALTDAEQDSKELKSAKRHALIERIADHDRPAVPGPRRAEGGAPRPGRPGCGRWPRRTRSTRRSSAPRSRSTSAGPTAAPRREIRPITCSVGVMPRTHGSALFTRGQTQALTLCTLGTAKEEQRIDDLSLDETKRYIHHYNFPPF